VSRGLLAAGAVFLLLAGGCSGGSEEGMQTPSRSTETGEAPPTSSGAAETDAEPEPGRPGNGGPLELEEVVSGLDAPVHAAAAPGEPGRLYVVEQAGRIRVLEGRRLREEPFLDITDKVRSGGEQGLLSVAFHPEYEGNGLFYVNYTNNAGDTRVVEYRAEAGTAGAEPRTLLAVDQPYANHNGGQLAFGPDGLLYVGMGDGGSGGDPENRAQDLGSLLGKLLRLDVDDPGADWELVAYGLRNPWRFSFDRLTGDLWIGDVGQEEFEEIDFVPADEVGELLNFGWDAFEGSAVYEDKEPSPGGRLVEPVSEYTHEFGCSVTGGFVYRGSDARQQAGGRYFYGDYCTGRIWSLARWRGEVTRRGHLFRVTQLTSFAEDADGELYLLSESGTIYRLAPR
jgi:glucose/arabinose dehydrogenase